MKSSGFGKHYELSKQVLQLKYYYIHIKLSYIPLRRHYLLIYSTLEALIPQLPKSWKPFTFFPNKWKVIQVLLKES